MTSSLNFGSEHQRYPWYRFLPRYSSLYKLLLRDPTFDDQLEEALVLPTERITVDLPSVTYQRSSLLLNASTYPFGAHSPSERRVAVTITSERSGAETCGQNLGLWHFS